MTFDELIAGLSPIGYWKLDDPAGPTVADSSGNGNDLNVVVASQVDFQQEGPAVGSPSMRFATRNDQLLGEQLTVPIQSYPVTLNGWVRVNTSSTTFSSLFSMSGPGNVDHFVLQNRQDPPQTREISRRSASNITTNFGTASVGTWAMFTGVFSPSGLRFYIDGGLRTAGTAVTNIPIAPYNRIGINRLERDAPSGGHNDVFYNRVAAFDRELTQSEIIDLFNAGLQEVIPPVDAPSGDPEYLRPRGSGTYLLPREDGGYLRTRSDSNTLLPRGEDTYLLPR